MESSAPVVGQKKVGWEHRVRMRDGTGIQTISMWLTWTVEECFCPIFDKWKVCFSASFETCWKAGWFDNRRFRFGYKDMVPMDYGQNIRRPELLIKVVVVQGWFPSEKRVVDLVCGP